MFKKIYLSEISDCHHLSFSLTTIVDSNYNEIKVPENIKRYLYDYDHSKFIECDQELAKNISSLYDGVLKQNDTMNKKLMPCMVKLVQTLEGMYKNYWLTSGTILGWYRECGIIPFTVDVDIAMSYEEYDETIKQKFRSGDKDLYLWLQIGQKKNSLEFRLGGCAFTYDLFFLYKISPKRYCNFYHNDYVTP